MLPVADITTKDIQLKIKEEFAMKRLPRQLNVFFFFLSRYILSTKNISVRRRYSKGYLIESTTDENFFSSDLCLAWISKNKLKEFGIKVTAVCPDSVLTGFGGKKIEYVEWSLEPKDVAHAIGYLVTESDTVNTAELIIKPRYNPRTVEWVK